MPGAFQVLSFLTPVRWVLLFPFYILRNLGSERFNSLLEIPQLISARPRIIMQASLTPNPSSPPSSPLPPSPGVPLKCSRTQHRNLPHRELECAFPVGPWVVGGAGQSKQQLVRQGSYEGKSVGPQFEVAGSPL